MSLQYRAVNEDEALTGEDYLVFTSHHAVASFFENCERLSIGLPARQIFCLEGETLKSLAPWKKARVAGVAPNAQLLAQVILATPGVKRVLFLCGSQRRNELPDLLQQRGILVREVVLYTSQVNRITISAPYSAVLFFSPSAADSFFETNVLRGTAPCFCIGDTTAAAVKSHTMNEVIVADYPSQENLLQKTIDYFSRQQIKQLHD